MRHWKPAFAAIVTCCAAAAIVRSNEEQNEPEFRVVKHQGNVVPYRPALEEMFGIGLTDDPADGLLALRTKGKLLPIWPGAAARMLYLDPEMHGREVVLTAREYADTPGLHLLKTQTVKDGVVHDAYYWCGICSIKSYARLPCDCCQEPVEFREEPAPKR